MGVATPDHTVALPSPTVFQLTLHARWSEDEAVGYIMYGIKVDILVNDHDKTYKTYTYLI
jgi:hypothetical protein